MALSRVMPVSALSSISPPSDVTVSLMVTEPLLDVRVILSSSPVVEIAPPVEFVVRLPPLATMVRASEAEVSSKSVVVPSPSVMVIRPTSRAPTISSTLIPSSLVPASAVMVATSSLKAIPPTVPTDPPAWKATPPAPLLTFSSLAASSLVMLPDAASNTPSLTLAKSRSSVISMAAAVTFVPSPSEPKVRSPVVISAASAVAISNRLAVPGFEPRSMVTSVSNGLMTTDSALMA